MLQLAPSSESALQRLSVLYTVAERWDDVLELYDRAIEQSKDKSRRIALLREAAQLAKDVANQPEKAIRYYQQLLPLVPDDAQVNTGLERLLERHERWAELIALWEGRLEDQSKKDREKSRARIAQVWLDNLSDPQNALAALQAAARRGRRRQGEPCTLLERVIEAPKATSGVRDAALDLLRSHYDATSRPREVIRVLEKIIAIDPTTRASSAKKRARVSPSSAMCRPRWITTRRCSRSRPTRRSTEEKLRQLAEQGGHHERYANGVAAARARRESMRRARSSCSPNPRARASSACRTPRARSGCSSKRSAVNGAPSTSSSSSRAASPRSTPRPNQPKERLAVLERQAHLEANDVARAAILSRGREARRVAR